MSMVPNVIETLPKMTIAWVGCTNVTDRQTTDRRTGDYIERKRDFTFAKNELILTWETFNMFNIINTFQNYFTRELLPDYISS